MSSRRFSRTTLSVAGAATLTLAVVAGGFVVANSAGAEKGQGRGTTTTTAAAPAPSTTAPKHGDHGGHGKGHDKDKDVDKKLVAQIKQGSEKYRNVEAAIADGFQPTDVCVADPALGGMGYHYANIDRVMDPAFDASIPEILIYTKDANGKLQLGAVEWFGVDPDQDLSTDAGRPNLNGIPFDGPMEGHEPGMPKHFDLHAWVWQNNPDGTFAPWNPAVTCN